MQRRQLYTVNGRPATETRPSQLLPTAERIFEYFIRDLEYAGSLVGELGQFLRAAAAPQLAGTPKREEK
jgi:hypothetical protein